jgi:hypothetical protein
MKKPLWNCTNLFLFPDDLEETVILSTLLPAVNLRKRNLMVGTCLHQLALICSSYFLSMFQFQFQFAKLLFILGKILNNTFNNCFFSRWTSTPTVSSHSCRWGYWNIDPNRCQQSNITYKQRLCKAIPSSSYLIWPPILLCIYNSIFF